MSSDTSLPTMAHYGEYIIDDRLELSLPNTTIRIEKIGENVFSYNRQDAEDNIVEKMIPTKSSSLKIELAPIRALNYPARRAQYTYLELDTSIFLSEGSAATVFVTCPIEIGVFMIHEDREDSLDWFTCDPINSRFCLYGPPESGTLCKYSKSKIVGSYDDSIPFVNAVLELSLQNQLDDGYTFSKIVFPAPDNKIYYKDSKAIVDSLTAVIKKKLLIEIIDVDTKSIETDWSTSPDFLKTESVKQLDMDVD